MGKYITQAGVARLWAAIEQKFADNSELTTGIQNAINEIPELDDMTNSDIDAITGYVEVLDVSESQAPINDIKAALNNNDNVQVTLANDITIDSGDRVFVSQGKKLTVVVEGNLTNNDAYSFIANGGEIVLEGTGSISGKGYVAYAQNGGTVTVNGGTYESTSSGQCIAALGANSKVVMNSGKIKSQEAGIMAFNGAEVEINGGELETVDNFAVGTNGSEGKGGNTIHIKNAVINAHIETAGYIACGIYAANNDTIIIEDTEINVTNGCGICQRGGTLVVKNGTKITTTWDETVQEGGVGDRKKNLGADGIIFDEEGLYPKGTVADHYPMALTVEAGVIFDIAQDYQNVHIYPADGIEPNVIIE